MAQNNNQRKSEGLCQKIYNAVSPLRGKNRENPVRISSPQTKPVPVSHQPSLTKMIPVEFDPLVQSAGKENSYAKPKQDFAGREILILNRQKFAESASRKREFARPGKEPTVSSRGKVDSTKGKPSNHVHFSKARSKKDNDDDDVHEGKFSDYINKVKHRMMKTASNIGGGGSGGGSFPRRDSFNDKVTNYINHAKIKIRTTTNVGGGKSLSLK